MSHCKAAVAECDRERFGNKICGGNSADVAISAHGVPDAAVGFKIFLHVGKAVTEKEDGGGIGVKRERAGNKIVAAMRVGKAKIFHHRFYCNGRGG